MNKKCFDHIIILLILVVFCDCDILDIHIEKNHLKQLFSDYDENVSLITYGSEPKLRENSLYMIKDIPSDALKNVNGKFMGMRDLQTLNGGKYVGLDNITVIELHGDRSLDHGLLVEFTEEFLEKKLDDTDKLEKTHMNEILESHGDVTIVNITNLTFSIESKRCITLFSKLSGKHSIPTELDKKWKCVSIRLNTPIPKEYLNCTITVPLKIEHSTSLFCTKDFCPPLNESLENCFLGTEPEAILDFNAAKKSRPSTLPATPIATTHSSHEHYTIGGIVLAVLAVISMAAVVVACTKCHRKKQQNGHDLENAIPLNQI